MKIELNKDKVKENKGFLTTLAILMMLLGGLQGYVITSTIEGTLIGVVVAIILYIFSCIGIIPVVGVFLYDWIAKSILSAVDVNLSWVYYVGLTISIVATIIGVLILGVFVVAIVSR